MCVHELCCQINYRKSEDAIMIGPQGPTHIQFIHRRYAKVHLVSLPTSFITHNYSIDHMVENKVK